MRDTFSSHLEPKKVDRVGRRGQKQPKLGIFEGTKYSKSVRHNKTLHECEQCLKRERFNEERNSAEQSKSEPSKKRKYGLKGMNYVCDQCNINFTRSSALKAHKMNKHKKHKMQMHTSKLP